MSVVEDSKGSVKEVLRDADAISLQENTGLYGQLVQGAQVVVCDPQGYLEAIGPSPEGELVQGTVDKVALVGFSDSIQLVGGQLDVLDVLLDMHRERLFSRWELAEAIG